MQKFVSLAFSTLLIALIVGCNRGSSPLIVGDKLSLPPDCWISRLSALNDGASPEYFRFDGKYPAGWPAGLELPAETFLILNPSLEVEKVRNTDPMFRDLRTIGFKGLCKGRPADVATHFEQSMDKAGLKVSISETPANDMIPQVSIPPRTDLSTENEASSPFPSAQVSISHSTDLGEYCYFSGAYTFGEFHPPS